MTYEEAIQKMREGKRVRNCNFTPDEFFEMQCGVIVCEMGYDMTGWFRDYDWQRDGWSVVEAK